MRLGIGEGIIVVDFDQLIKNGELVKAARLFAKEGYENGEFGFTRKLLIESLANRVESLEKEKVGMAELVDDSVEISWKIEQQNKRYRELLEMIQKMTVYDDCREAEIYELVTNELEEESN